MLLCIIMVIRKWFQCISFIYIMHVYIFLVVIIVSQSMGHLYHSNDSSTIVSRHRIIAKNTKRTISLNKSYTPLTLYRIHVL